MLVGNFKEMDSVSMNFFPENHGKGTVDGHFNWVGSAVKNIANQWKDPVNDVSDAIKNLAQRTGVCVTPLVLEKSGHKAMAKTMVVPGVTGIHKISRKKKVYIVENTVFKPRLQVEKKVPREDKPRKKKPSRDSLILTLRNKIERRNRYL